MIGRLLVVTLMVATAPLAAQTPRPLEVDDLFEIKRVANPQISSDGE